MKFPIPDDPTFTVIFDLEVCSSMPSAYPPRRDELMLYLTPPSPPQHFNLNLPAGSDTVSDFPI